MLAKIYVPLKKTILSKKYFLNHNIPELLGMTLFLKNVIGQLLLQKGSVGKVKHDVI